MVHTIVSIVRRETACLCDNHFNDLIPEGAGGGGGGQPYCKVMPDSMKKSAGIFRKIKFPFPASHWYCLLCGKILACHFSCMPV